MNTPSSSQNEPWAVIQSDNWAPHQQGDSWWWGWRDRLLSKVSGWLKRRDVLGYPKFRRKSNRPLSLISSLW